MVAALDDHPARDSLQWPVASLWRPCEGPEGKNTSLQSPFVAPEKPSGWLEQSLDDHWLVYIEN